MAKVSAIPENLFKYSDACTQGAEQFQTWVRTVLTPAIKEYERGGGHSCSILDASVAKQLAAAFYTDRDVRTVGHAFQEAGGTLVRSPNTPITAPEKAVNASFERMQKQAAHQAKINAGAALAARVEKVPGARNMKQITDELARHANDPYFAAGFFNNLSQRQTEHLMSNETGIRALLSAFAGGALSKTASDQVAQALVWAGSRGVPLDLDHYHITVAEQHALLRGLLANPAAAANFARSLDDVEFLRLWESPAFSTHPGLRPLLLKIFSHHPSFPRGDKPPGDADLSQELRFANSLPYPTVAPHGLDRNGKPFSRNELAVLSWLELHKDAILREANRFGIPPKAIAAAIAWEALKNKDWWRRFANMPPASATEILPMDGLGHSAGPGKVHIHAQVVREIEGNIIPRRGTNERQELLRTTDGSITYVAAIMHGFAQTAEYKGKPSIRDRVPNLVNLYQGSNLKNWSVELDGWKKPYGPGEPYDFGRDKEKHMSGWVTTAEGQRFLKYALE